MWNTAVLVLSSIIDYHERRYFRSHVLQKVCQYFAYKVRYTSSATEIPEFNITPDVALELLMAANFLDC